MPVFTVLKIFTHSRGQLGRGLIVEEQSAAVIQALEGIKIQFIAAGGWHSAAISGKSGFEFIFKYFLFFIAGVIYDIYYLSQGLLVVPS